MPDWPEYAWWGFWIFVGIACYWLLPPLLILATQKMEASPELVEYDPEETPPPRSVARYFKEEREGLEGCGFRWLSSVLLPNPVPNVRAVLELYAHDRNSDAAMVTAIFGVSDTAPPMQARYVEFIAQFRGHDVTMIQTNDNRDVSAFPDSPDEPTFRFPHVKDVQKLYALHQALVDRHGGGARKYLAVLDEFRGNVAEYLRVRVLREGYERQVRGGMLRYDERRDCFVPTVAGAYRMTWKLLWPVKPLIQSRYWNWGKRLEKELGVTEREYS